ncbi:hypothetical protein O9K51_00345 [Purpureocillium lavendulum]|uniref:Uncharacterized protein n=1 Tax=Purpureocillium lavendulum TaxID=1247861 RepID=A0AB34G265_9HYPO|nr:hypothetical protein O9K51_00345 [Purpureocillium lavendulum]
MEDPAVLAASNPHQRRQQHHLTCTHQDWKPAPTPVLPLLLLRLRRGHWILFTNRRAQQHQLWLQTPDLSNSPRAQRRAGTNP